MTVPQDWWKSFFSGLVVEFWKGAIPDGATTADLDFFLGGLALQKGDRVLDVPCGHGRFALELARRGFRVTGVDLSGEFLSAATAASKREGLAIDWQQTDMRSLPWRGEFDAVLCAGNSFGYFEDEENEAFLKAAVAALKPGGRMVLEAGWVAESRFPDFVEGRDIEAGGVHFATRSAYDPRTGRAESRYTLTRGDSSEERAATFRVYTAREILRLLETAGLADVELWGGPGQPFALGSPRLVAVGRRQRPGPEGRGQNAAVSPRLPNVPDEFV
jgi:SAM-dependent methyltransferase